MLPYGNRFMKYQRLIEIYVKPDLHEKIIKLKGSKTSDQFLRELLEKNSGRRLLAQPPTDMGKQRPPTRRSIP